MAKKLYWPPRMDDDSDDFQEACDMLEKIGAFFTRPSEYQYKVGDMSYFPACIPNCPVSGGTYTLDPVTKRVSGHTTSTIPGDH